MKVEEDLAGDASTIEQLEQDEKPIARQPRTENLLNLISRFLETAGNVLLIQGPPGVGKTTLAFELLRRVQATRIGRNEIPPNRLYVSSRASPTKLRKHFPWIRDVVDPFSARTAPDNGTEGSADLKVSDVDNVFSKVLAMKHSRQRGLVVIDSWEGAIRNTSDDGRRMLESAILSDPDESRVGVVLVTEGGRVGDLPSLVDGIVTLSLSELEGRRLRSIGVDKLRGLRIQSDRGLFSLDKGGFTLLPKTRLESESPVKSRILSPVSHSETSFSTGSRDLDAMLEGGIEKGSSLLLDASDIVPTEGVSLLLRIITANFINQGGSSFIVPPGTISSDNQADALRLLVGNETLEERVRIAEYNQGLPPRNWRVPLKSKVMDDLPLFDKCWKELKALSSSIMLTADLDKLVQVYGDDLMLPGLTDMGATIRDSGAVTVGIASQQNKVRESFLRIANYFLKVETIKDTMVIYGVKPFTNIHGVEFTFDKGYPSLTLTEIV